MSITVGRVMSMYHTWFSDECIGRQMSCLSESHFISLLPHSGSEAGFDLRGIREFLTDSSSEVLFGFSLDATEMGDACRPQSPGHDHIGFFKESAESRSSKPSPPSLYL